MTGTPLRLYDYLFSGNGYKIRLALSPPQISVEYTFIDLPAGEFKSGKLPAINPAGE